MINASAPGFLAGQRTGPPLQQSDFDPRTARPGAAPLLLRIIAVTILAVPSSMVLKPLGASGTVPLMLAGALFVLWAASCVFGLHDPIPYRHPGRLAVTLLLLATCLSYVALYSGWTGPSTVASRAAADRWLILLVGSAAVVFVTTETVRTVSEALSLVRALLAGGAICCLVAVVQFFLQINPMEWFQYVMPGFTYNSGDTVFQNRGALLRVAGSTFTPIELAVVCSMLLPLSIWRGLFDPRGRWWINWAGTALLVFAIAATISRSGVLGVTVAMAVFVPFMPSQARKWTAIFAPAAVAGLFLGIPGLMSTLFAALTPEQGDASISTRTNNYPRVAAMFEQRPILGVGPGNYMPKNALLFLDNQYLHTTVTLGAVGLVCIVAYFLLPGAASLVAAQAAQAPALKSLAGAVGASGLVGAVCSMTFDSLSFPVFALTYPFIVGLGGAVWIMTKNERLLISTGGHQWTPLP